MPVLITWINVASHHALCSHYPEMLVTDTV
jgi:hypothetical protein